MKKRVALFLTKRILAIAVLIALFDAMGCVSHLVYHPTEDLFQTPSNLGLVYKDVLLESTDGNRIHAWWIPSENPRATVIFCHGNGGNIGDRMAHTRVFHNLSLSVLLFDYQGFGQSQGKPSEQGTYDDARATWNFLVNEKKIPPEKIFVFGESLGGAIAIKLATEVEPGILFVDSSFTSTYDVAKTHYGWVPKFLLRKYLYDSQSRISQVKAPVCIIHSKDDEVIPFAHGKALFKRVRSPKEFVEIRGSHNGGFIQSEDRYVGAIDAFITQAMETHE